MTTFKRISWFGALLFSLGLGCGAMDRSQDVAADVLAVSGSDVAREQLALPDGDGPAARDGMGPVGALELDRLRTMLGLSDEQVAQIQPILDATRTALEGIRAQVKAGTLSDADARAQVKALHEQQKDQILALLTPEQQAKWKELRDHHCGPFDITRLAEVLGLSDEQVSQIKVIQDAAQAKANDIHTQVESGALTRDEAHLQLDQLMKDTRDAISGVLTAEQQAELAKILAAHRHRPRGDLGGSFAGPPPPPR